MLFLLSLIGLLIGYLFAHTIEHIYIKAKAALVQREHHDWLKSAMPNQTKESV